MRGATLGVWGGGRTLKEHNDRLRKGSNRVRVAGLKLNKSKCVFAAETITFLGHVLSAAGIKPDPGKIKWYT